MYSYFEAEAQARQMRAEFIARHVKRLVGFVLSRKRSEMKGAVAA
jgi:hypothetical protein